VFLSPNWAFRAVLWGAHGGGGEEFGKKREKKKNKKKKVGGALLLRAHLSGSKLSSSGSETTAAPLDSVRKLMNSWDPGGGSCFQGSTPLPGKRKREGRKKRTGSFGEFIHNAMSMKQRSGNDREVSYGLSPRNVVEDKGL